MRNNLLMISQLNLSLRSSSSMNHLRNLMPMMSRNLIKPNLMKILTTSKKLNLRKFQHITLNSERKSDSTSKNR